MKRHHFAGGAATHGSMFHRAPGSIGASSFPSRVVKGMRAAGRMGARPHHDAQPAGRERRRREPPARAAWSGAGRAERHRGRSPRDRRASPIRSRRRRRRRARSKSAASPITPSAGENRSMTLDVVNSDNQKVGSVDLADAVFSGPIKTDLIWESVVRQNASERRGTHKAKNRALVSGGGKKPYKQKGTGRRRSDRRARRSGAMAARCSRRSRAATTSDLPKKVERGALQGGVHGQAQGRRGRRRRRAQGVGEEDQGRPPSC